MTFDPEELERLARTLRIRTSPVLGMDAADAIDALLAERKALIAFADSVRRLADSGDGSRTFDDCIRALMLIDDLARSALHQKGEGQ